MKFYKFVSSGNDFLLFHSEEFQANQVSRILHSHYGIKADGLINLVEDKVYDIFMHIYNNDGSEATMCGNGLKIVGHYLKNVLKIHKKTFFINTMSGVYEVGYKSGMVYVLLNKATNTGKVNDVFLLACGNKHAIEVVDIIDENELLKLSKNENMKEYNLSQVAIKSKDMICIRTYEKGVGFTLSCGSASVACFSLLRQEHKVHKRCIICTQGGTYLIEESDDKVVLYGEVKMICMGEYF